MAQSLRSVPVLLDDGQRVQNLRVPQLLSALTGLGVPTDTLPKLRAEKVILLTTTLSKSRATVGQFGALEDGRIINDLSADDVRAELVARGGDPAHQGCQRSELQRIVRVLTNVPVLAAAPAFAFGTQVLPQPLAAGGGAAALAPLAVAPLPVPQAGATQALATQVGATPAGATQAAQGATVPAAPTNALSTAPRPFMLPALRPTFTVVHSHKSPPGSVHPYNRSEPFLEITAACPLGAFLSSCKDFLNVDGQLSLLRAQLLFASSLHLAHGENVAFGATVKVETLNRIADLLAPGMLNVTPPKSALDLVDAAAYLTRNLRHQLSLCAHDFDPPVMDAAVLSDAGLATVFDSSFGGVPLQKFFQAQCIVGGAGLPLSRQHAHNRELALLDHDTFGRLPSASFRASAQRDSLTLVLVFNRFLAFNNLPDPVLPFDIQGFMAAVDEDTGVFNEDP